MSYDEENNLETGVSVEVRVITQQTKECGCWWWFE